MSLLNAIRNLQQQEALTEAITLCQQALAVQPDTPELLALFAVLSCQMQDFQQGRKCLAALQAKLIQLNAETLTDIAATHLLLKEPLSALEALNAALALAPKLYLAQIRRGLVMMQLGQFAEARDDLHTALPHCPNAQQAAIRINIARCALYLGDNNEALEQIQQTQNLGGSHLEAWLLAAVDTYIALNRWHDAETAIHHAVEAGSEELKCVKLFAWVLAAQDKHGQATHALREALKQHPHDIDLLMQLAALARVQGHYGEVLHHLYTAIKIEPDNASLWVQLAQSGHKHFDGASAKLAAEKALALTEKEIGLKRAEALVAIATVTTEAQQAENYYQQALNQVPNYAPASLGLGHLLLQWGRIDEATVFFEAVAAHHPILGYGALINARRFPDDPEILARIEKLAYLPSMQGTVSGSLLFDLAAAWEHQKDYAKAFRFANEANEASRKFLSYSAVRHTQYCQAIRHIFTSEFFAQRRDYGNPSCLPAFVLGMPRSGTTLVEQILGGHQAVFVAGEIGILSGVIQKLNAWERHLGSGQQYPSCVRDLTAEQARYFADDILKELRQYSPDAHYIVDKLPHNFEHIGFIRLLFPHAPIINVQREPRDVAVSNFFIDYQAKFGGMGFAYDLKDIGEQIRDYQALMRHWDKILSKPILTVCYEDVVTNTEAIARKILAYLELAWTDSVLNFQNLERAVKTASVWQVRQPIYNTSTEKWRRYQDFLQPLETVLTATATEDTTMAASVELPAGYFFQGMAYLQDNLPEQAIAVFAKLLRHHPQHAAALHMLGIANYQLGNHQKALALVKTSIAHQCHHASWYKNLSTILMALGQLDDAQAAKAKSEQLKTLNRLSSEVSTSIFENTDII